MIERTLALAKLMKQRELSSVCHHLFLSDGASDVGRWHQASDCSFALNKGHKNMNTYEDTACTKILKNSI